jgi:hypothetical protein
MTSTSNRKRPLLVAVYVDEPEKRELTKVASKAGLGLGVWLRVLALTTVRRSDSDGVHVEPAGASR